LGISLIIAATIIRIGYAIFKRRNKNRKLNWKMTVYLSLRNTGKCGSFFQPHIPPHLIDA